MPPPAHCLPPRVFVEFAGRLRRCCPWGEAANNCLHCQQLFHPLEHPSQRSGCLLALPPLSSSPASTAPECPVARRSTTRQSHTSRRSRRQVDFRVSVTRVGNNLLFPSRPLASLVNEPADGFCPRDFRFFLFRLLRFAFSALLFVRHVSTFPRPLRRLPKQIGFRERLSSPANSNFSAPFATSRRRPAAVLTRRADSASRTFA